MAESMRKFRDWQARGLLLAIVVFAVAAGCSQQAAGPQVDAATGSAQVEIAGRSFTLELALDDDARYQGLSDRESIPPAGGMLFVFPDVRRRQFVMRRCLVPIDIIFLDPAGRVLRMHQMQMEPYDRSDSELTLYSSRWPAQFAIELQGGMLDQLDLQVGDTVRMPLAELKAKAR